MTPPADRLLTALSLALLGALAVLWVAVAVVLPIDNWDGYEYLLNSRRLAGHDLTHLRYGWVPLRPPLLSALLVPLQWGYAPRGEGTSLAGVHLAMVALALASLAATYLALRDAFPKPVALAGAAMVGVNALVVHNAPFVYADVSSIGAVAAACALAVRVTRRPSPGAVALLGVSLAAAALLKFPLFMLPGVVLLADATHRLVGNLALARADALRPEPWEGRARALGGFVARPWIPLGIASGAGLVALALVGLQLRLTPGLEHPFDAALEALKVPFAGAGYPVNDPPDELVGDLWALCGPPAFVLAGLGLLRGLWRRSFPDVLHGGWLVGFVGVMSLKIVHHEGRYVLPALPSFAFFALSGVEALLSAWRWWTRAGPLAPTLPPPLNPWRVAASRAALVVTLLLAWPTVAGAREALYFRDPVYTNPFLPELAKWVHARVGRDGPLLAAPWIRGGVFFVYNTYARSPVVRPHDEYWHFHYVNQNGLAWYLDRELSQLQVYQAPIPRTQVSAQPYRYTVHLPQAWAGAVTGDLLFLEAFPRHGVVVTTAQDWFETDTVSRAPEPPHPLVARYFQRSTLLREPASGAGAAYAAGAQRVSLSRDGTLWRAEPPLPSGTTAFGRDGLDGPPRPLASFAEPPAVLELLAVEEARFAAR